MKHLLIFFMAFTFLFSFEACKDDHNDNKTKNREFGNCLKNEIFENSGPKSCDLFPLDTSNICTVIDLDTILRLTDFQKGWLPYYCSSLGEDIYYVDEDGNETSLVVLDKQASVSSVVFYSNDTCPDDSMKKIYYCVKFERANVSAYSNLLDMKFNIELRSDFIGVVTNSSQSEATLYVTSVRKTDSLNYVIAHIRILLGMDKNYISGSFFSKHYDEIEILGKTFYDVYTYDNTFNDDYIKMYYNSEYGIVSFIEKSGKQWRIKTE